MRKICIVTSTRADFGPLRPLIDEINRRDDLELQLIVTGTHLAPSFGETVKEINDYSYPICKKIEMCIDSDSSTGVGKSMGLLLLSISEAFAELQPDIIVVLGDRTELIAIVGAAVVHKIPVAHISGGEVTEGAIDDMVRHAITKLSSLHFTAMEQSSVRLRQMGEEGQRIFTVGELGLDRNNAPALMTRGEFEQFIGVHLLGKNLLITYHPVTNDDNEPPSQSIEELLVALNFMDDTLLIFTESNADVGGQIINRKLREFVKQNPHKSVLFKSLGQRAYTSAMKYVDAVVGNSSSGIWEAPSFKVPTLNIGSRQKGRVTGEQTLTVECKSEQIASSLVAIYSSAFQEKLVNVSNPYGDGKSASTVADILRRIDLSEISKAKKFVDYPTKFEM